MRILGIDPGLRITGFGCIEFDAPGAGRGPADAVIVEAGVIRLSASSGKGLAGHGTAKSVSVRLAELDSDFRGILARLGPDVVAVEGLFAHYKHPATSIVMGHARGVLLLAVQQAGCTLVELKPNEVKKSLTGFGHAAKDQMQRSIQRHFRLATLPKPPDMADALAIALCAAARLSRAGGVAGPTSRRRGGRSRGLLPDGVHVHDPLKSLPPPSDPIKDALGAARPQPSHHRRRATGPE